MKKKVHSTCISMTGIISLLRDGSTVCFNPETMDETKVIVAWTPEVMEIDAIKQLKHALQKYTGFQWDFRD